MPRAQNVSIENNFTGGLKTEFTGLNFPENACTETYNCVFNRFGNITRRKGFDKEPNSTETALNRTNSSLSSYIWYNADGAGNVNIHVVQVGSSLYFYNQTAATIAQPLSGRRLATSAIDLTAYEASGGASSAYFECQYADGTGYLIVTNAACDPLYCTYNADGTITATRITIQIRDFKGVEEVGVIDSYRPATLTAAHQYNLGNQGWGKYWETNSSTSNDLTINTKSFTVSAGLPVQAGDRVYCLDTSTAGADYALRGLSRSVTGLVISYAGTTLTFSTVSVTGTAATITSWLITPEPPVLRGWKSDIGNYPSNSDVWWRFKDTDGKFNPRATVGEVTANAGRASRGYFILDAFNQLRSTNTGISGITDVTTIARPTTCAWYAGRAWYAGINSQGNNEDIYFSQIIEQRDQFGRCYQRNDPTAEDFFDLLPSDGGVIKIPSAGQIYKLVPIQNGLLVFAINGVWFITGSQGLGFTANDYSVIKISSIPTVSASSFVTVNGFPMWWNDQGIYTVAGGERGGLDVQNITLTTIGSFYEDIPIESKRRARGDYDPFNMIVQWVYKSSSSSSRDASGDIEADALTSESLVNAYKFDRILNLNLQINAFYPWTIEEMASGVSYYINDVKYIKYSAATNAPDPGFRYLASIAVGSSFLFTFAAEYSTTYTDWSSIGSQFAANYSSYFKTGYKLHGQAQRKFQSNYVYVFSDNGEDTEYRIRGIWNFASSGNSGTYSVPSVAIQNRSENITVDGEYYSYLTKRHKIRGHGLAMQIHVFSVDGEPFNIIGWSVWETSNQHV